MTMNDTKPIFQSKTIFTILAALLVPEVIEVIGLMIESGVLEAIRGYIADFALTLPEIIEIALLLLAGVFRFTAKKTLTLTSKIPTNRSIRQG